MSTRIALSELTAGQRAFAQRASAVEASLSPDGAGAFLYQTERGLTRRTLIDPAGNVLDAEMFWSTARARSGYDRPRVDAGRRGSPLCRR
jgi:hypothetical protein